MSQIIRQLHASLWYAPAKRMRDLLQAAGVFMWLTLSAAVFRLAQGVFATSRKPQRVVPALVHLWMRVYGSLTIIADQEGFL